MQHTHVYTVFVLIWWLNEKKGKNLILNFTTKWIPVAASR